MYSSIWAEQWPIIKYRALKIIEIFFKEIDILFSNFIICSRRKNTTTTTKNNNKGLRYENRI